MVIGGFRSVCIFLCFKDRCFWTSEFVCFHVFGLLALEFFTFLLKHSKLKFPRWNCSYRASKSSRNTDMGGRKRIDTSPPTLNFAASSRYYVLYLTGKDWKLWQRFDWRRRKTPYPETFLTTQVRNSWVGSWFQSVHKYPIFWTASGE